MLSRIVMGITQPLMVGRAAHAAGRTVGRASSSQQRAPRAADHGEHERLKVSGTEVVWPCGLVMTRENAGSRRLDAFRVLGIERSFAVDIPYVESRYRSLQRQLHPDKFALSDDDERTTAAVASAAVNESVATVRDVLRRAKHLLVLYEGDTDAEGDDASGEQQEEEEAETIEDAEMLMRVMEAREEVEEAAGSRPQLEVLQARHGQEFDECVSSLSEIFESAGRSGGQEWMDLAKAKVQELTYLRRIRDAVDKELELLMQND